MTNERREEILKFFQVADLENPVSLLSIQNALEEADRCQTQDT